MTSGLRAPSRVLCNEEAQCAHVVFVVLCIYISNFLIATKMLLRLTAGMTIIPTFRRVSY